MRKLLVLACLAGFCFAMSAEGVEKTMKECKGGNATSCAKVGWAYYNGKGVKKI